MSKSISILGCGWLGLPLAKQLIQQNYNVKGSTTSDCKLKLLSFNKIEPSVITIDNFNYDTISKFLEAEILIIAIPSKNEKGFQELVKFIEVSTVKKVIFISATSVYASLNSVVSELDETKNVPLKRIEAIFENHKAFKTTILRFGGLFGYDRNPANWFENKLIPQPNGFVNMIHQDDCVNIILKIIEKDVFAVVFNACANHHPTRKDFYTQARLVSGKPSPKFKFEDSLVYKKISSDKLIARLNYQFIKSNLLEAL